MAEHNKIYGNVSVWQLNFINRLGNLLTAINFWVYFDGNEKTNK